MRAKDPKILVCLKNCEGNPRTELVKLPFSQAQLYASKLTLRMLGYDRKSSTKLPVIDLKLKSDHALKTILYPPVDPVRVYSRSGKFENIHFDRELKEIIDCYRPQMPLEAQYFWFHSFMNADNEIRCCWYSQKVWAKYHMRRNAAVIGRNICLLLELILFRSGKSRGEMNVVQLLKPAYDKQTLPGGRAIKVFPRQLGPVRDTIWEAKKAEKAVVYARIIRELVKNKFGNIGD